MVPIDPWARKTTYWASRGPLPFPIPSLWARPSLLLLGLSELGLSLGSATGAICCLEWDHRSLAWVLKL